MPRISERIIIRSNDPQKFFCYTPGILVTEKGRLLVTLDVGGEGIKELHGIHEVTMSTRRRGLGIVISSDDDGKTWSEIDIPKDLSFEKDQPLKTNQNGAHIFPFWHARAFQAGNSLYIIGNSGDIQIIRSDDNGDSWTKPAALTANEHWHASACNTIIYDNKIYLAMEKIFYRENFFGGWNVAGLSPILLSAKIDGNLLNTDNWKFSDTFIFRDHFSTQHGERFGIPFYPATDFAPVLLAQDSKGKHVTNAPIGWLEANVVKITDHDHVWFDEQAFHLILRAHTGGTNYACLIKINESNNGSMVPSMQKTPSDKEQLFLPLPGGHLKFYILFDEQTNLFWLASNQATDSMRKITSLDEVGRYGLPNNERHRMQLYFSRNCVDWCFATMLGYSKNEMHARNYPAMAIKGNDLHVVARSGDEHTKDAQYSNCITHHVVKDFRDLVY